VRWVHFEPAAVAGTARRRAFLPSGMVARCIRRCWASVSLIRCWSRLRVRSGTSWRRGLGGGDAFDADAGREDGQPVGHGLEQGQ
jgi:hypothetical protein